MRVSAASILASALLAGVVATAVTVAIEKWGGLVGGLLGTVPSTIVPAAVGIHLAGGDEALLASMAIVPLGMLLNALFLGAWLVLPRWFSHASRPLLWTSLGSLAIWGLLGAIVLTLVGGLLSPNLSDRALALVGFVPLFITCLLYTSDAADD